MSGAGNDFIIIKAQKGLNLKAFAKKVCDRTNGIGADGVLVLDKSGKSDYRMRIINADSSEAEMCGNGVRCLAAYIVANKKPKKKLFSIQTCAGTILAEAKGEIANVRLSDPSGFVSDVPLEISKQKVNVSFIDTGVPHVVIFVSALDDIDVNIIGSKIRYHKKFKPKGTNVNFVEQESATLISNRTYERGVEAETKACGTGSVASALVAYLKMKPSIQNKKSAKIRVRTTSGEILNVQFDLVLGKIENVWLRGSAKFIASGEYYL